MEMNSHVRKIFSICYEVTLKRKWQVLETPTYTDYTRYETTVSPLCYSSKTCLPSDEEGKKEKTVSNS